MSKQSGLIKFQGKMDGISFYRKKGGHFARMANGPRKERIFTDPKFARTRENISEFNGLSVMVNSFRQTLKPVSNFIDGDLRKRTVRIFRTITKRSDGIRGQRPIQLSQHREQLKYLEINSLTALSDAMAARYATTHTQERTSASVTLQESSIREMITAPANGNFFRLVHLVGAIADTVYDETSSKYAPADLLFNTLSNVSFSDYLPSKAQQSLAVTLETSLPNLPPPGENVSVVQGLGIIFYEQIGSVYYPLAENSAMKIIDIF